MKANRILTAIAVVFITISTQAQSSLTVVRRVPREATVVVHSGVRYKYYGGVYYKPYGRSYVVVRPPVGLTLAVLPLGYTRVTIGSTLYFYAAGIYYAERSSGKYEVVPAPQEPTLNAVGMHLSALPDGFQSLQISGKKYYKVNNTYYEKSISENGAESYVVVGKIE